MPNQAPSPRTQVKRIPKRGDYDPKNIKAIIDGSTICHVAFAFQGHPTLLPMAFCRIGEWIYLHGSSKNRMLMSLKENPQISLAFTHLDGLVLARSAFHHSMNYRSVIVYAEALEVEDEAEKMQASEALVEHIAPGRWQEIRQPNSQEIKATGFFKVNIAEASAKIRQGPPIDDEADYALDVWAGVIPCELKFGDPEPDPRQLNPTT